MGNAENLEKGLGSDWKTLLDAGRQPCDQVPGAASKTGNELKNPIDQAGHVADASIARAFMVLLERNGDF